MADTPQVDVAEILAEMDELGRAKWDLAVARWENGKLREELARVSNESQPVGPRKVEPV